VAGIIKHEYRRIQPAVLLLFLPCLVCFALTASSAQTKAVLTSNVRDDVEQLRLVLSKSTQSVVDTAVRGLRNHLQSLDGSMSQAVNVAKKRLIALTDSLLRSAQDSLDAPRQDSLRVLGNSLGMQFASHESSTRLMLDSRLSHTLEDMQKAKGMFSACTDCENRSEFDERLADFKDFADSLVSDFHGTASEIADERSDLLADAFDAARDSLLDVRDGLVDNRLNDIEVWRYRVSRLVLSSAYASHNAYRGRDNGLLQQSFSPSVTYRHSSGFGIQASTYWLNDGGNRWDNVQLTGGYDFRLSGVIGGSLSYSHFWFNDSSKSELSVFTDNAQGGISLDWPALSIAALGSMNFGKATEFTLTTSISHDFEIPLTLYNKVTISPSFSWVLGQQNSDLTTLLTTKAKGRKAVAITSVQTKSTSTFSVLDYELSIPALIELGPVTVAPSATYIMPLNVVDASSRKSFVNLEFGIFFTIR
jgi:hypothetical protein